jgi:hypothetical protein
MNTGTQGPERGEHAQTIASVMIPSRTMRPAAIGHRISKAPRRRPLLSATQPVSAHYGPETPRLLYLIARRCPTERVYSHANRTRLSAQVKPHFFVLAAATRVGSFLITRSNIDSNTRAPTHASFGNWRVQHRRELTRIGQKRLKWPSTLSAICVNLMLNISTTGASDGNR